jgi:hypothetical protein
MSNQDCRLMAQSLDLGNGIDRASRRAVPAPVDIQVERARRTLKCDERMADLARRGFSDAIEVRP